MKKSFFFKLSSRLFWGTAGWFLPVILMLVSLLLGSCQDKDYKEVPEASASLALTHDQKVERGKYLVTTIGCADCHSPKKFGERGLEIVQGLEYSGYQEGQELPKASVDAVQNGWMLMNGDLTAAVGPWGVSFAANISSDETGIGNWSLDQFKTSLRKGKYKGMENARDLLPPMPWFNFAQLSDEDLEAMYHYLKSTKPVRNVVPAPIPPGGIAMR